MFFFKSVAHTASLQWFVEYFKKKFFILYTFLEATFQNFHDKSTYHAKCVRALFSLVYNVSFFMHEKNAQKQNVMCRFRLLIIISLSVLLIAMFILNLVELHLCNKF